jgi:hypothetical protein
MDLRLNKVVSLLAKKLVVGVALASGLSLTIGHHTHANYKVEAFPPGTTFALDADGHYTIPTKPAMWEDSFDNIVPTVGLNDMIDKYWKGSSYTAAFYVGLTSATPTVAAGDTMSSHSGWTEVTAYDEAVRQTLTLGTVSAAAVDNTASRAVFTISTNSTSIGGAFIVTNATKGGTSGVLVSVAAFTGGNRTLNDDDILRVTVTISAAST